MLDNFLIIKINYDNLYYFYILIIIIIKRKYYKKNYHNV